MSIKWSLPFRVDNQNLYTILISVTQCMLPVLIIILLHLIILIITYLVKSTNCEASCYGRLNTQRLQSYSLFLFPPS
jgi:hypothetical protein